MGLITVQKIDGFKEHWNSSLEHITDVHQIGMYKKSGRDIYSYLSMLFIVINLLLQDTKKKKQVMKE